LFHEREFILFIYAYLMIFKCNIRKLYEMFSDAHSHLDFTAIKEIEEAKKYNVEPILVAGTDIHSSEIAIRLAQEYSSIFACIGLHPWKADQYNEKTLVELKGLASSNKVAAISEIGLDYFGRRTSTGEFTTECVSRETQMNVFHNQLGLAKDLELPVIIHERASTEDILQILAKENNAEYGAVIHGFSGDINIAQRYIELGTYLSIGPRAMNNERNELFIKAVEWIPIDKILLETDAGNPVEVIKVAEKIASIKGLTTEEVGELATSNLKKLIKKRL